MPFGTEPHSDAGQFTLADFVPPEARSLDDPQRDLPRIAKDKKLMMAIEAAPADVPTRHDLDCADARNL